MSAARQRRKAAPRPTGRRGWRIFFAVLLLIIAGLGGLGGWAWWQHGLRHSSAPQAQGEEAARPAAVHESAREEVPPSHEKSESGEKPVAPEAMPAKTSHDAPGEAAGETIREEASRTAEENIPPSAAGEAESTPPSGHGTATDKAAVKTEGREGPAPGAPAETTEHEAAVNPTAAEAGESVSRHAPVPEEKSAPGAGEEKKAPGSVETAAQTAHEAEPGGGAAVKPEEEQKKKDHAASEGKAPEKKAAPAQEVAVLPPPPLPKKDVPARPDALKPAPDPDLVQKSDKGLLPVISPDGRQPWRVYARPFRRRGNEPLIAIVIGDMGLSAAATEAVTQQLPGEVTMAFAPYGGELARQIPAARAAGHEVLLQLPMEPFNYPTNDPGPYALLTSLGASANIDRLEWLLGRFTGYVGVTTYMGEKFTVSSKDMRPVINVLRRRGLMLVDARRNAASIAAIMARDLGVPQAYSNLTIDRHASRVAIDTSLRELERIALRDGVAVGFASAYPVTIDRIANWAPGLELKGIRLAPITAVANLQPLDQ